MKKIYPLFFFFLSLCTMAQTACDDANYYIVSSYSHVKDSYESNNIDHVKYYADRAVNSLKSFMKQMNSCQCTNAQRLARKSYDMLLKVDYQETYEDARFFVKRARDSIKASVIEDDKCSARRAQNNASEEAVAYTETADTETTEDQSNLSDLEQQQLQLKKQQEALKRKEQEIKAKLAAQQEKEQILEKQELIRNYQNALISNIKSYNATLKLCGSDHEEFTYAENSEGLENKSVNEIKDHYKREIKTMTNAFLSALNSGN